MAIESTAYMVSPKRDLRLPVLIVVVALIAGIGYLVTLMPEDVPKPVMMKESEPTGDIYVPIVSVKRLQQSEGEIGSSAVGLQAKTYLLDARRLLDEQKYQQAFDHLNQNRQVVMHVPESLMLMGEALMGLDDYAAARDFFNSAIEREPGYHDAYFGYAMAVEGLGELEEAMGAMRAYLHLQKDPDPYRLKVARARSAIWEWETALGRGRWGPTKGIPPGFTAEELKRDGRGVGTKMPIPGTKDESGYSDYVIKHSDIIPMYGDKLE